MDMQKIMENGFSPEEIIKYLSKAFPDLGNKLSYALSAGYTAPQVVNYLSKLDLGQMNIINNKSKVDTRGMTPLQKAQAFSKEGGSEARFLKGLGGILASTALPIAGGKLLGTALQRALPQAAQKFAPQVGNLLGKLNNEEEPSPIDQPPNVQPPIENPSISVSDVLSKYPGMIKSIEKLSEDNSPEAIAAYFKKFDMQNAKKIEKEAGQPLEKLIDDYLKQAPNQQINNQNQQAIQENPEVLKEKAEITPQNNQPLDKITPQKQPSSQIAALPSGQIGEIESVKNGIAKINVDGQIKHRKLDEVVTPPVPMEEIGNLYESLIKSIPESARSSMINVAGYDPNHNELIFMPHNGALYVYKDIPEEFASKIKDAMFQAKTTGENFYGAWSAGESSRGAGLSALIKELQKLYGGKGKEYIRKYEKIYDLLALPKQAIQEKLKREREERKRKKKRAK